MSHFYLDPDLLNAAASLLKEAAGFIKALALLVTASRMKRKR